MSFPNFAFSAPWLCHGPSLQDCRAFPVLGSILNLELTRLRSKSTLIRPELSRASYWRDRMV